MTRERKTLIPVACTLDASDLPDRLAEWRSTLATVIRREPIDGGLRLVLPTDVAVGQLAELAAAEQDCCRFFGFAITMDERGVALEVTAPPDALDLVQSLFGETSG